MVKVIGIVLVVVHLFLLLWSSGGMLEWLMVKVPWKPYSNPEFPRWVLFIHWISVLVASSLFLYGYFSHWQHTPKAMVVGYGMMAVVCAIETFGYMTSKTKFLAMGLEYAAYIVILIILYNTAFSSRYFN